MISYKHRFHGHNALRGVYSNGKTARSSIIGLKYALNPRRKDFRVAVVVSKKVNKSAVQRNRIRRRIYELVRLQQPNMTEAYDLIFTVYTDTIASMPAADLEKQVVKLLQESKVV